jgi:hypothetical protein
MISVPTRHTLNVSLLLHRNNTAELAEANTEDITDDRRGLTVLDIDSCEDVYIEGISVDGGDRGIVINNSVDVRGGDWSFQRTRISVDSVNSDVEVENLDIS